MDPSRRLPELRASDADRERVLSRLRDAHSEGRLDLDDFYQRLDAVYEAKTYGELDRVTHDLPPVSATPSRPPRQDLHTPPTTPPPAAPSTPRSLRAMWAMWLSAVLINIVIWASVAIGSGDAPYFWPMWVAGPWGAVLLSMTLVWYVTRRDGGKGGQQRLSR